MTSKRYVFLKEVSARKKMEWFEDKSEHFRYRTAINLNIVYSKRDDHQSHHAGTAHHWVHLRLDTLDEVEGHLEEGVSTWH